MSGLASPDVFVVRRATGEALRAELADKRVQTVAVVGGTEERSVPEKERLRRTLADNQIRALARLGMEIETLFRSTFEYWGTITAPVAIGPDGTPVAEPMLAGDALHGTGASGGRVRGRARLIRSIAEAARLEPGDIMMAAATDPGWTAIFPLASGLVIEVGGQPSHGAIVAREYGIPAVVNVPGAMQTIREGRLIEVDGMTGRVALVSNAREAPGAASATSRASRENSTKPSSAISSPPTPVSQGPRQDVNRVMPSHINGRQAAANRRMQQVWIWRMISGRRANLWAYAAASWESCRRQPPTTAEERSLGAHPQRCSRKKARTSRLASGRCGSAGSKLCPELGIGIKRTSPPAVRN